MLIKLLEPANIKHEAGEIVKVSPDRASFLCSVGCAVPVAENREAVDVEVPEDKKPLRTGKKK